MDARTKIDVICIRDIVRDAMEAKRYDRKAAIELLQTTTDPEINEAFRILGIEQAMRNFQNNDRHGASEREPEPPPIHHRVNMSPEAVQARADRSLARRLWWDRASLYGGDVLLGNATRRDLLVSAGEFGKQEQGNKNVRLFHEDLAKRMPASGKPVKVRDFFTVDKVIERAKAHGVL